MGLDYLSLTRSADTLSGGEAQRIRLASQIGSGLTGVMYVLDEPSIGLHQRDNARLIDTLKRLRDLGNSVIVVEHDEEAIHAADHVVDMGPGRRRARRRGRRAGHAHRDRAQPRLAHRAVPVGHARDRRCRRSATAATPKRSLRVAGASGNNLKNVTVDIPVGLFVCVTGVSGSGKSTLINDTLYASAARHLYGSSTEPAEHEAIEGLDHFDKVINVDQSPIGRTPRSNPATYTGLFTPIRDLFAGTPESRARGYGPGRFSFNVKGGRCEACQGDGVIKVEMHFLPDVYVTCDVCHGKRYNRETLEVHYRGRNICEVLDMTVEAALEFFSAVPAIARKLQTLMEVGLGYVRLGQSATTLSGGEAQRVKLALELSKRDTGRTLFILDEPTTGLHFHDIDLLLRVLHRLRDHGNTVVVIEHNLDVIKTADWVIDLGPEGGDGGGTIIAQGTPEDIAATPESFTGRYPRARARAREPPEGFRMKDVRASSSLGSFRAALAAADPLEIVPAHLPPPPGGPDARRRRGQGRRLDGRRRRGVLASRARRSRAWSSPGTGTGCPARRIRVVEAGHPVPDEAGRGGGRARSSRAPARSGEDDLLLVLVSGGGSSLLSLPVDGVPMADLKAVTRDLLASGAPIQDMNTIRKHLSTIQGGRLALASRAPRARARDLGRDRRRPHPHRLRSLLSRPDHLRGLARHPRSASASRPPASIAAHLARGAAGRDPGDAQAGRPGVQPRRCPRHRHRARAASWRPRPSCSRAASRRWCSATASPGEAREVAKVHAAIARQLRQHAHPFRPPVAVDLRGGDDGHPARDGQGRALQRVPALARRGARRPREHLGARGRHRRHRRRRGERRGDRRPRTRSRGRRPWGWMPSACSPTTTGTASSPRWTTSSCTGPTRTNVNDFRIDPRPVGARKRKSRPAGRLSSCGSARGRLRRPSLPWPALPSARGGPSARPAPSARCRPGGSPT